MFIPGGFLFALLLKPKARPHVLYSGFLVSACIETIQSFMPDRTGDPVDVLMNGSGALLGAAGALGVHRWRRVRRERQGKYGSVPGGGAGFEGSRRGFSGPAPPLFAVLGRCVGV